MPDALIAKGLHPIVSRIEDVLAQNRVTLVKRKPDRVDERIDAEDDHQRRGWKQPRKRVFRGEPARHAPVRPYWLWDGDGTHCLPPCLNGFRAISAASRPRSEL